VGEEIAGISLRVVAGGKVPDTVGTAAAVRSKPRRISLSPP